MTAWGGTWRAGDSARSGAVPGVTPQIPSLSCYARHSSKDQNYFGALGVTILRLDLLDL